MRLLLFKTMALSDINTIFSCPFSLLTFLSYLFQSFLVNILYIQPYVSIFFFLKLFLLAQNIHLGAKQKDLSSLLKIVHFIDITSVQLGQVCPQLYNYNKIPFEKERSIKMTMAIKSINQNTMETMLKPRATRPNVCADTLSPLLSASLAY